MYFQNDSYLYSILLYALFAIYLLIIVFVTTKQNELHYSKLIIFYFKIMFVSLTIVTQNQINWNSIFPFGLKSWKVLSFLAEHTPEQM